jgi:hypothetical protein
MLYGGAPHLVAAAYALIGWQMILSGTALGIVSASRATEGQLAALVPLPLVVAAFAIACYSMRQAALAMRSMSR